MITNYERRFRLFFISPTEIANCFVMNTVSDGDILNKICLDVPEGTELVHTLYDERMGSFCLCLYHSSWPPIPDAEYPPTIDVERRIIKITPNVGYRLPNRLVKETEPYDVALFEKECMNPALGEPHNQRS